MHCTKESLLRAGELAVVNLGRFAVSLGFMFLFQFLFGAPNVLVGVAIGVGFTTLPKMDLGVRPGVMAALVLLLYVGAGLAGQTALLPVWAALPLNFLFVVLLLLLSGEPAGLKPSISFMLCFVFCQATPVPWRQYPGRLADTLAAGGLVAAACLLSWKKRGVQGGRSLRGQLARCARRRGYILRMGLGIAAAMGVGMALHLKKPLWISIVVMSLTQIEIRETFQRIRYRFFGTLAGIAGFVVLMQLLVPPRYASLAILALGYLSFFTPEYRHKQVVNAISAINASLVLLDPSSAIANRLLCFAGGVLIVLLLWFLEHRARRVLRGRPRPSPLPGGHGRPAA